MCYISVQSNYVILIYNKLSLIVINMMSIFIIHIFIEIRVLRVFF